jgi:hypothetical protein
MADARRKVLAGLKRKTHDEEEQQGASAAADGIDLNYLIGTTCMMIV